MSYQGPLQNTANHCNCSSLLHIYAVMGRDLYEGHSNGREIFTTSSYPLHIYCLHRATMKENALRGGGLRSALLRRGEIGIEGTGGCRKKVREKEGFLKALPSLRHWSCRR
ncbi:hypothetical protein L484_008587 [Morus notabilis]|uniref:Uncharacterized protein n=1 Tax=Morus notabilis TaxID=981085 RepID=W9QJJ3_9ROSA|nr:hypothetical protein L484_008587 [Morus notabilis]